MAKRASRPLTNTQQRIKSTRELRDIMEEYRGPVTYPSESIDSETTHLVDNQAIIQAIVAVVLLLDLRSGSSGDFKLYELAQVYFHDAKFRRAVNYLMTERESDLRSNSVTAKKLN